MGGWSREQSSNDHCLSECCLYDCPGDRPSLDTPCVRPGCGEWSGRVLSRWFDRLANCEPFRRVPILRLERVSERNCESVGPCHGWTEDRNGKLHPVINGRTHRHQSIHAIFCFRGGLPGGSIHGTSHGELEYWGELRDRCTFASGR